VVKIDRTVFIHLNWRGQDVIIPEIADSIQIAHGGAPNTHSIIGIGNLAFPSHQDVKTVAISGQKFHKSWIERFIDTDWTPRQYADWLTDLRNSREIAELTIESDIDSLNHNFDVLIDFESWTVPAHFEREIIEYSLVMHEFKNHGIIQLEPKISPAGEPEIIEPPPPRIERRPHPESPYTVVRGDSLTAIARRFTGDGNRWREMYDIPENRAVIYQRATPADRGNLIFPGQKFIIPESWAS